MAGTLPQRIDQAAAAIRRHHDAPIDAGLVLGSGLGGLVNAVSVEATIDYGDIPGFVTSTAPGHAGRLVIGTLSGRRIGLMQGRFHLYEGWTAGDVAFPVYVLKALDAARYIVTNAAGALAPDFRPADVMLIADHINFTGHNPIIGNHDPAIGPQFPDMSRAYDPDLSATAMTAAANLGIGLHRGIYAGVAGPSLETSAERRFLRLAGADAVGMSTVTEVIAANHCGLSVLGLSAITNMATGGPEQQPDTIEEVLENAAKAGGKMQAIIEAVLSAST